MSNKKWIYLLVKKYVLYYKVRYIVKTWSAFYIENIAGRFKIQGKMLYLMIINNKLKLGLNTPQVQSLTVYYIESPSISHARESLIEPVFSLETLWTQVNTKNRQLSLKWLCILKMKNNNITKTWKLKKFYWMCVLISENQIYFTEYRNTVT